MKEAQTENDITIRWDMGLNQKRLAWFSMPKLEMKGLQALNKGSWGGGGGEMWESVGSVVKIPNSECYRRRGGSGLTVSRCLRRDLSRAPAERRRTNRLHSWILGGLCLEGNEL
jgi:hypothetical protein